MQTFDPLGAQVKATVEPRQGSRLLVEAELVSSVAWLIRLRWLAGLGVLLATWSTGALFGLGAPRLPLYAIGTGILLYNLTFYLIEQRLTRTSAKAEAFRRLSVWQAILDWVAMALLIHFSGGIESPAIFFFIFHIIIVSIFFSARTAAAFAILAAVLLSAIALLEFYALMPHRAIIGYLEAPLYRNSLYVASVLFFFTSTGLISAYLAASIQGRLRQREEEVIRLSESLRRATIRLQTLNDGARVINSTLDLPRVLEGLVKNTAEAMGVRACSIRLLDPGGQNLEPVAVFGLSQAYLNKGPVDAITNPLARRVLSGEVVNIPDAPDSTLLQYPEEARQEGIRSVLSAPLIGKSGPLGILRAYAVEPSRFTTEDEAFLVAIASQGSIAIENAMAYKAIEDLDQAKGQFVRIVTHELRSPVSVVHSLLRTLTSGYVGEIPDQQMDILQRARRRVEFLQSLIDDLLDLAAGKNEFKRVEPFEPISLVEVVERVVRRYEMVSKEKGLTLEWHQQAGPCEAKVMASQDGLDRIFNNLVSNAVKYTPAGGLVTVNLSCLDGKAQVEVVDTGIGIPEEAQEHLFEEFYRAPNARALEREGTGLGLTIVRDLVVRFGGSIWFESSLGAGSHFIVKLPLIAPPSTKESYRGDHDQ
jgi:signal transduction histidine kinase